ncbi:hypothetical protein HYW42_03905 [Candidatus Daviesbacteria bacterium]|nr:hypothetical protein [Candidatus Daviesbacteria bacterium]
MGTVLTVIFNILLGVLGTAILTTQIMTGKSLSSTGLSLQLKDTGLILWIVLLVVYFWGAKKLWGKTVGGLITNKLTGKK